jgi:hypothetical protein
MTPMKYSTKIDECLSELETAPEGFEAAVLMASVH